MQWKSEGEAEIISVRNAASCQMKATKASYFNYSHVKRGLERKEIEKKETEMKLCLSYEVKVTESHLY